MAVTLLSAIEEAMHKGTLTNYRYANGVKREEKGEREGRQGEDGNVPGEIGAPTHYVQGD